MKRFDTFAIKQRLIERLRRHEKWAMVIDNGTVSNLIDVIAEGLAENARYMEYLLCENKWDTAQNMSSLRKMAGLISNKKSRKKSAIGYVIVSHTDESNHNRLNNLGSKFFNLDAPSDYDDLIYKAGNKMQQAALVPWTYSIQYTVPKYTRFITTNGIEFVSTKDVTSRALTTEFSKISSNENEYNNFLRLGGWNGIKYLKIPVIQGIRRNIRLGLAQHVRYEAFMVNTNNVEAAENSISREFFHVKVTVNDKEEEWHEIQSIDLAEPYDKVFESRLTEDETQVIIRFGNGITGQMLPEGAIVTLDYLETMGAKGNLTSKYQMKSMMLPYGYLMQDPRNGLIGQFLSCQNDAPIEGGLDLETEDEYRISAPKTYLNSYSTGTTHEYLAKIKKYSPINLMKVAIKADNDLNEIDIADLESSDINNVISVTSKKTEISALDTTGNAIENADETFIRPLKIIMGDLKSPNDSFIYKKPNIIKIAPSFKVFSETFTMSDKEIETSIKAAVLSKYSIKNAEFANEIYKSNLMLYASLFEFTKATKLKVEAVADVDFDNILWTRDYRAGEVIAIPFSFPYNYGMNSTMAGFKNWKHDCNYLLKADLITSTRLVDNYDRTFFLLDSRSVNHPDLEDAKCHFVLNGKETESSLDHTVRIENVTANFFPNKNINTFRRMARVAQFDRIEDITDGDFMKKALDFEQFPKEILPYEIDEVGNFKVYNESEIDWKDTDLFDRLANNSSLGYRRNERFIDNVDIQLTENYTELNDYFARGYFIIPTKAIGADTVLVNVPDVLKPYRVSQYLKEYFTLNIYADPLEQDIHSANWNDIICTEKDLIRVQRITV